MRGSCWRKSRSRRENREKVDVVEEAQDVITVEDSEEEYGDVVCIPVVCVHSSKVQCPCKYYYIPE